MSDMERTGRVIIFKDEEEAKMWFRIMNDTLRQNSRPQFDYDIKGKQEIDKVIRQELIKFEESGRTPTKIALSPQMCVKLNLIFPSQYATVMMFDGLPVNKDESLIDEQIVIQ